MPVVLRRSLRLAPLRRFALGLAGVAAAPVALAAQAPAAPEARVLAPGVTYRHVVDPRGPWSMHVLRVDLRRPGVVLRHVRARDSLRGREAPSAMARRAAAAGAEVLAAVNADFFDLGSGESENSQVLDGEWWKGAMVTDSPYDTFDNAHAQFGLTRSGRPVMDRFQLHARAWGRAGVMPILSVNLRTTGRYEGSTLYTPRFGEATPRDTSRAMVEAAMTTAGRRGDTLLYVRRGPVVAGSGTAIPRDGAVLSAYGARSSALRAMADGDTVRVLLGTLPRVPALRLLVGGWPRILKDGRSVAGDAAILEGTISRNAEARHPRTAIGFSRDSGTVVLLAVDGRSEDSGGMTLVELAAAMRRFGAWQAMNLDGGGSTTMVVRGAVVNVPSDSTRERAVGSALLVTVADGCGSAAPPSLRRPPACGTARRAGRLVPVRRN